MFRYIEVTPEEEEKIIRKAAEIIHNKGMDTAAIIFLETLKPVIFIGGQMGRFFLMPFLPFFGDRVYEGGEKFITTFEKRENVKKLTTLLEDILKKEKEKEKKEQTTEKGQPRRGWRRLLPF